VVLRVKGELDPHVCGVQFSPDGRGLLVADWSYGLRLWDTVARKELWRTEQACQPSAFSPDGKTVAASLDGGPEVILLDATTGKQRSRLRMTTKAGEGHHNPVTAIAWWLSSRWRAARRRGGRSGNARRSQQAAVLTSGVSP